MSTPLLSNYRVSLLYRLKQVYAPRLVWLGIVIILPLVIAGLSRSVAGAYEITVAFGFAYFVQRYYTSTFFAEKLHRFFPGQDVVVAENKLSKLDAVALKEIIEALNRIKASGVNEADQQPIEIAIQRLITHEDQSANHIMHIDLIYEHLEKIKTLSFKLTEELKHPSQELSEEIELSQQHLKYLQLQLQQQIHRFKG